MRLDVICQQFSEALRDEPLPEDFGKGIRQQHNRETPELSTDHEFHYLKHHGWEFHP
jgi:hypothetical protein